jgi:hypothetical protein
MVLRAVLLVAAWGALTGVARAEDDRLDRMADELRNNDDFRVRTQAALALGASKDKRAVSPLCSGLEDSNTTVRAAAAAALGKLALGGLQCLKARLADETNDSVRSVLEKAIEKVKSGQKPLVTAETKFYVAVGPTTDKTGRSGKEVDDLVHNAMEGAASSLEGCVIAARDETEEQAKAVFAKWKRVKGFFLWPKVQAPDYSGGNLTLRFEIAIFTYPGKALKGTIPLKLTMPDVSRGDKDSENDLIQRAASSAFEKFSENVERLE